MRSIFLVAASVAVSGCTGGILIADPVAGTGAGVHKVTFKQCDQPDRVTYSDANGWFQFNPFDPNSNAIDTSKEIPMDSTMVC
jgi:hypothetical protein